jgi:nicotinate dehydrogenase large molybdopterin subunit
MKMKNNLGLSEYRVIGKSIPKKDAYDKVLGKAVYAADIKLPGMLYGKVLRSKYPHALIKKIDTNKADKLPGVVKVVTAKDVPGVNLIGRKILDQPVVSSDKVKYIGDVVALVAAESEEGAREALKLIEIEYEELPPLTDPEEALKPDAPLIHGDRENNTLAHIKIRKGDIKEAFEKCDIVIRNQFRTPFAEHMSLETESAVAAPRDDGSIDVWGATDHPFKVRENVARVIGVSANKVHYHDTTIGGSFGGKKDTAIDICSRTALLAFLTGKPVKMVYSREESILASSKRHPAVIDHTLGATKDGKLIACEVKITLDTGVYASKGDDDWGVPSIAAIFASGPYEIPHVKIDSISVYTNNPIGGPMRGFGSPQVVFAQESQMDELARRLNIDPIQLRLTNALRLGSQTATGQVLKHSVGFISTMNKVVEKLKAVITTYPPPAANKKRGIGLACGWHLVGNGGGNEYAQALLYLKKDGALELRTGLCDVGQGAKTVLAQIAAEELGLSIEDIEVPDPETDLDFESMNTGASRVTTFGGNATIRAARAAKRRLIELASGLLCEPEDMLEWKEGKIYHKSDPQKQISLEEIAKKVFGFFERERLLIGHGFWQTLPTLGMDSETGQGETMHVYTYGTQAAIVYVDLDTYEVEVLKIIAAHDVGKAINPVGVEGQLEGGISMGLGWSMMEELIVHRGYVLNQSLANYLVPTAADCPEIECIIVEEPNEMGPFGAKGIGEAPLNPTAPAIANAIYDAIGVRIRDLPVTPDKIWAALHEPKLQFLKEVLTR